MAPSRASALASDPTNDRLINAREVAKLISYSHHSMPRKMKEPDFPRKYHLSKHRVAWRLSDVLAYIEALPRS